MNAIRTIDLMTSVAQQHINQSASIYLFIRSCKRYGYSVQEFEKFSESAKPCAMERVNN